MGEKFCMFVKKTASQVRASDKTGRHAEKYFVWLNRLTNHSREAWLARRGSQDALE